MTDATPIATTHERAERRSRTNSSPPNLAGADAVYRRYPGSTRMIGGDVLPVVERRDTPGNLLAVPCGLAGRAR